MQTATMKAPTREPRFAFTEREAACFRGDLAGIRLDGARVLEIGFGAGSLMEWMRRQGAVAVGVEIDRRLADAAAAAGFETRPDDLTSWAHREAGTYDAVVGIDVLEHMDLDRVCLTLRSTFVLLRPGGVAVFRFPNGQSPFGRVWQYGDPTHRCVLSAPLLAACAEPAGLVIERAGDAFQPAPQVPVIGPALGLLRCGLRDACSAGLRRLYGLGDVPFAANITARLRKP